MTEKTAPSFNVDIHMAGDISAAGVTIQRYGLEVGMCVSLTAQSFIYSGGREEGFRVGFINYPRFPKEPCELVARARDLASVLCQALGQKSYSIVTPVETIWCSNRDRTDAVNAELLAVAEILAALKDKDGKRIPTNDEIDAARAAIMRAKSLSQPT